MLIYFFITLLIGVCLGFVTFIFGSVLNVIASLIPNLFPYNLLLLPLIGFLTIMIRNRNIEQLGNSMPNVFKTTKKAQGLSILIVPFQIIATWLAHLAGASVGREGVAVQLGATIANNVGKLNSDLKKDQLTRVGMAAGFAGLFGTPIAAAVFSYEVTRNRPQSISCVIGTLIATYSANFISNLLGLNHFHLQLEFISLDVRQIFFFILSIIIFVMVGSAFGLSLKKFKMVYSKIKLPDSIKILVLSLIGALALGLLLNGRYMSLGTNLIDLAFNQPQSIYFFDFIFKFILTMYFVGIGFQGGEVTPLFAIGASLGVVLSSIFSLPATILAAVGYAFTFGSATNGYFTAAVLLGEIFGVSMLPYGVVALVVSLIVRADNHSIYPNLEWE